MFKFLLCLVAVAGVTLAYDFQDSDFNEYLFEELQTIFEDDAPDALSRARRDTVPPAAVPSSAPSDSPKECGRRDRMKDMFCCQGEKHDRDQIEAYKDLKKECYAEVRGNNADDFVDPFDCQKMQQVKEQMVCVSECVAKKFNALDDNGELKRDAILAQLRTKVGDTQWKADILETVVDKCLAETKEKRAQAPADAKGCNRCPLEFHHCIWREFSNSCPAELRIDSPKCSKQRERLAKGDTSFLNKHFLHHFLHSRNEERE